MGKIKVMTVDDSAVVRPVKNRSEPGKHLPMSAMVRDLFGRAINITPGAWGVEPERPLAALLGSCVSVCFYDPHIRLAGMNHFLLPSRISNSNNPNDITLAGDAAMETMLNAMLSKGAKKCRLLAKMFGGGTIVSKTSLNIGQRNVVFAREWIGREGIKLAAIDVLGNCSRKLLIDPISGDVFCCRSVVDRSAEEKLAATEAAYEKRLIGLTAKNNIELF